MLPIVPIVFTPVLERADDAHYTMPRRGVGLAAGIDLFAPKSITFEPQERHCIPTGWKVKMPLHHYGQICDTSSLAHRTGLHVLAGVIDQDYTGELCVLMANLGKEPTKLFPYEKMAQLLIIPYYNGEIIHEMKPEPAETFPCGSARGARGLKTLMSPLVVDLSDASSSSGDAAWERAAKRSESPCKTPEKGCN